jgi:hypothetical protein
LIGLKNLIVVFLVFGCICSHAQTGFSFAADLSLMRNFSPDQNFWCVGQTVQGNFHFNKKQTAYAWLNYYTPGKFKNDFTATAKSSTTSPSAIPFQASAKWKIGQVSLGWKHYFKGGFDEEAGYSIYSIAGFGLMFTKAENVFSPAIDTTLYTTITTAGNGKFYRLTFDLGAGVEFPIGGSFFLYSDLRTWLPTSDAPSPYLHSNKNVPLPVMINAGMRILFGY